MPYEILVHITASTTKEGDDRYRRQELAYRDFKPAKTIYLDERDGEASAPRYRHPRQRVLQHEQSLQIYDIKRDTPGPNSFDGIQSELLNSAPGTDGTQVILDTQRAVGAFDSQISTITDSFDDRVSLSWETQRPAKRPRTALSIEDESSIEGANVPASCASFSNRSPYARHSFFCGLDPLSSQLPDSYGLSKLAGTNSIRRLDEAPNAETLSTLNREILPDISYCSTKEADAAAVLLGRRVGGSPSNYNKSASSNLPSQIAPPTFDILHIKKATEETRGMFQNRASTLGGLMATPIQQNSLTRNGGMMHNHRPLRLPYNEENAPQTGQGPIVQTTEQRSGRSESMEGHRTRLSESIAMTTPLSTPRNMKNQQQLEQRHDSIKALPLEVFSPKASVGTNGPITFVSKILSKSLAYPTLRKRWKRASFHRPVKQFEIGYWVIETRAWTAELQFLFWTYLTSQIELGQLGPSTWCKRVPEPGQLGMVKVFCWGEIVEHMYLFLLTISDTGISSQEVCWLDGANSVVIRVGKRPPLY